MEAVIHGLAIYFTLLVIIRLSGRRTLARCPPSTAKRAGSVCLNSFGRLDLAPLN